MKRFRVGYYLSTSLLLLAGLGTGRWEFYFLFTALFFLVAVAFALNLWTFFSFSCRYELAAAKIVKGDTPILKIYIRNNKPFPINGMRATVQTPLPTEQKQLIINIPPGDIGCYEIELCCKYRGVYDVGITSLEITDIFGLLPMRFYLRHLPHYRLEQLVVYPRVLQLSSPNTSACDSAMFSGYKMQRPAAKGEEYFDTRQYRFGDPFKRIHKALSARKRELYVKRYDISPEASALIVVDTCDNSFTGEDALRYSDIACECAVAIANYCLNSEYIVDLVCSGEDEPVIEGKSPYDFPKLLDYLAIVRFGVGGNVCSALQLDYRSGTKVSEVYVISSRNDQDFIDALSALKESGMYIRLFMPALQCVEEGVQTDFSIEDISVTVVRNADDIASQ